MTRLATVLADAGGVRAPRERAAQIRAELVEALSAGANELALPRSGYETPVSVAMAAFGEALMAIVPVDPALHADPNAVNEREWTLVAAIVGSLVESAAAMEVGGPEDLTLRVGSWEGWLVLALAVPAAEALDDVELAVEAFAEQVADVDRLRAGAYAVPSAAIGDVGELRPPIGELHPLLIAEAVARFGGRPADHTSVS